MWPIATARAVCLCVYACVSVYLTSVNPVQMAETIQVPFGDWTWVGTRNRVLDSGADIPVGRYNIGEHITYPGPL